MAVKSAQVASPPFEIKPQMVFYPWVMALGFQDLGSWMIPLEVFSNLTVVLCFGVGESISASAFYNDSNK